MTTKNIIKNYCKDARELAIAFIPRKENNKCFKRNVTWKEIEKEFTN